MKSMKKLLLNIKEWHKNGEIINNIGKGADTQSDKDHLVAD